MNNEFDPEIKAALQQRNIPQHRNGFFDELEESLETRPKLSKRPRLIALSGTAVAAAIAALVLVASGNDGGKAPEVVAPTTTQPTPTVTELNPLLASEVIAKTSATFASVKAVNGTIESQMFRRTDLVGNVNQPYSEKLDFRLSANGNLWTRSYQNRDAGTSTPFDTAFNAAEGTLTTNSPDGYPGSVVETGLDDDNRSSRLGRFDRFASAVRSLESAKNPQVKTITFENRPAWELEIEGATDTLAATPDHWVVTVDQETAFPVRLYGTFKGQPVEESVVRNLEVNPELKDSDFEVKFPDGVTPIRKEGPWKRVDLAKVEGVVGYKPFVPTSLPKGFELSTVSVSKDAGMGGPEGMNRRNRNVVQLTYRSGLQTIVVSTRSSQIPNDDGYPWLDPYSYEGEPDSAKEKITLKGGAFDGVKAEVVVKGKSTPHVWAIGSRWLLTVSGDASRDELVNMAQSFQQP